MRERQIREIAERLRLTLSEPYAVTGATVRVAASIGVAFATPTSTSAELMRNADLAMYRAKSSGKNRVELYVPQMQAEVMRRAELAARLRTALRNGEFTLLHQPVVDLRTGGVDGVHAQPRWRSAQGALFSPSEFLRFADGPPDARTGRTDGKGEFCDGRERSEVSRWMLEEAVERAAQRHRLGHQVPVTVRLPVWRLMGRELPPKNVESLLARHELPPDCLLLELAEHDPHVPLEELERRLVALRRVGVRIGLGGFGTGYAAMVALRRLPVDVLTLERAFTEGLVESARLHKITSGMLRIARDLGLRVVADGVDRPEQLLVLREIGCTHGRGTAFSGPLEETGLRGTLDRGGYPMPLPHHTGLTVVSAGAGPMPVRKGQSAGPDPLTGPLASPASRSHNETSVPPA